MIRYCTMLVTALGLMATVGCVNTKLTSPNGTTFSSTRVLWNGQVAEASMTDTNGTSVSLKGYRSEAAEMAEAVASGVAKGLVQGAKK